MISSLWVACKVSAILFIAGMFFCWLAKPAEASWFRKRAIPVIVALYVLGMTLPNVWFYWPVLAAMIVFLARSRIEAAMLYVIVLLFSPEVGREIGFAGVYILNFNKWAIAGVGLFIAVSQHRARGQASRGWFDIPLWLVMVVNMWVTARGALSSTALIRGELTIVLSFILPYYSFSRSLRRPEDLRRAMLVFAFSAFVLSILAIYEGRTSFLPYESIQSHLGTSSPINPYSKQRGGALRASTSFPESTSFGLFLAMGFVAMLVNRDAFRAKRYWVVALGVIVVGLYMANARSAVIALGLGLIAYDLYRRRYGSLLMKTGGFALIYAVALLIAQFSTSFAERIGQSAGSSGTVTYRQQLITRGMEEIRKHPWSGTDVDQVLVALADLRQGEGIVDFVNGYIYYGLVAGIPGMICVFLCFAIMAWRALRSRRLLREHRQLTEIGGAVFAVALISMVTTLLTGFGSRSDVIFFLFAGMGSALGALVATRTSTLSDMPAAPTQQPQDAPRAFAQYPGAA